LYATLRAYLPDYPDGIAIINVPSGISVGKLLAELNIPCEEVKIVLVNGRHEELACRLQDNDRIGLFPPIGGG
jgi:Sulfur transfer protein involved in thiamine biosynthesis